MGSGQNHSDCKCTGASRCTCNSAAPLQHPVHFKISTWIAGTRYGKGEWEEGREREGGRGREVGQSKRKQTHRLFIHEKHFHPGPAVLYHFGNVLLHGKHHVHGGELTGVPQPFPPPLAGQVNPWACWLGLSAASSQPGLASGSTGRPEPAGSCSSAAESGVAGRLAEVPGVPWVAWPSSLVLRPEDAGGRGSGSRRPAGLRARRPGCLPPASGEAEGELFA